MSATGGSITTSGGYRYHTFTSSGVLVVSENTGVSADILVVAGGGGGSIDNSTGAGAGGMLEVSEVLSVGNHTVIVGAGGSGSFQGDGTNGSNSQFDSHIAIGGGGGKKWSTSNGGSGSGASALNDIGQGYDVEPGGLGTTGQGHPGGQGFYFQDYMFGTAFGFFGSGGGAGGSGRTAKNTATSVGGPGKAWLNGVTYAAGGRSGQIYPGPSAPAANTGNGAPTRPGYANTTGLSGGSGIVIVRYPI